MRSFKVLVAEKDAGVRDKVLALLEANGHEGAAAESGSSVLEELEEWPECQLVITDIATLITMRNKGQHERIRTIPAIVYGEESNVKESTEIFHGVYVAKETSDAKFLAAIEAIIPKPKKTKKLKRA